ncbi:MAG: endonuclease/exonuclease/phosphatase family protein [Candidatus Nitrotoga sp.]|nr:endonuclease/exonuclease/phosphatase family protein [Candidatus Nitrotoga sp.]
MIGRVETWLRRLRRSLSRSIWLARLLRLPVSEGAPTRPGLIMIQIDGLSQPQFERALKHGKLPFLRRLIKREHYQLHTHYSGLPATTPAVQAELFYGVKGAVPAFSFRDHVSRQVVRMYEPDAAARVEALYSGAGHEALLKDGSAYSDNFTGGAAESHFCPSSMGWGPTLRAANPLVLLAFLLSNLYSFLRVAVLLLLEFGLALVDVVRGISRGQDFAKELKFILARVSISILLRELCVIGGKIDIARGLPIIHINFLGYDEQSHRRGPRSLFAHWTLKGIDDAVARLWRAANRSVWRHYEVWIYSDHGQAKVKPYHKAQGYSLEEAVTAAFVTARANTQSARTNGVNSIQTQRVRFLGGNKIQRLFSVLGMNSEDTDENQPAIAALGPVGHVYSPQQLNSEERDVIARELAQTHKIPIVLTVEAPGMLCARTEAGEFHLPQELVELFGAQHPFIDAIGEDLVRLCEHADAGDFVLLGWRDGILPLTFAEENGAHAGVSPEETNGFALLPVDAPLAEREHVYLRPTDLRNAALHHLGRTSHKASTARKCSVAAQTDTLRVMTYNVHSCIGMDGKLDAERIARVIARARPDVVALQELDVGRARTEGMDQAHLIARYLEMEFHFHPSLHLEEERYGDAILTHLPQRLVKVGPLPGLADKPQLEPRGALWVAIELHGKEIQIINTHLGLYPRERLAQIDTLLGSDWLAHEQCRRDLVILCGDFNALPSSSVYRRLGGRLRDAQTVAQHHRPKGTYSSRFPTVRIDHIFISSGLEVTGINVPASEFARIASDHLPLVAELRIPRLNAP